MAFVRDFPRTYLHPVNQDATSGHLRLYLFQSLAASVYGHLGMVRYAFLNKDRRTLYVAINLLRVKDEEPMLFAFGVFVTRDGQASEVSFFKDMRRVAG